AALALTGCADKDDSAPRRNGSCAQHFVTQQRQVAVAALATTPSVDSAIQVATRARADAENKLQPAYAAEEAAKMAAQAASVVYQASNSQESPAYTKALEVATRMSLDAEQKRADAEAAVISANTAMEAATTAFRNLSQVDAPVQNIA